MKEFSARFTKPVIVPAGKSVDLTVSATVIEVTSTGVRLEISATSATIENYKIAAGNEIVTVRSDLFSGADKVVSS